MQVQIEYKDTWKKISVPDSSEVIKYGTKKFPEIPAHPDPEKAVRESLKNPIGGDKLSDRVKKGDNVTIAFDDPIKVPRSIKTTIPVIMDELIEAGVNEKDIELISANGAHPKLRDSELKEHLGADIYKRFCPFQGAKSRIKNHDCVNDTIYLGETEFGDQVEYNKIVEETDQLIYTGTIFPSPYGGYPGQGVVIGLAGKRALNSLHSPEVFRNEKMLHGDYKPEKNKYRKHKLAVHNKIEEKTGNEIFYVDALQKEAMKKSRCEMIQPFAGHVPELEQEEYPEADKHFTVKTHQFDIVVIGVPYTLDYGTSDNPGIALNAAQRPLRMWRNKPLLKENGVLITLLKCTGELDEKKRPGDPLAMKIFRECFNLMDLYDHSEDFWNNKELLHKYNHESAFAPIHHLFVAANIATLWKLAQETICTGEIKPGLIREIGLKPAKNFEKALEKAKEMVGEDPEILVLPRYFHEPKPIFEVE